MDRDKAHVQKYFNYLGQALITVLAKERAPYLTLNGEVGHLRHGPGVRWQSHNKGGRSCKD